MGRTIKSTFEHIKIVGIAAAKALLDKNNVNFEEIGAIVFVTQTPGYNNPATACVLHYRLGLPKECIAFDVNQGCSGYVYGLNIIASLMVTSNVNKALLLAGDTSAKKIFPQIKQTENSINMLFGDSGTATLLVKEDGAPVISSSLFTDGSGYQAITNIIYSWRHPNGMRKIMDDVAVFNFAISDVPESIQAFMSAEGTTPAVYDCLVPHQASLFVLKQLAKRTGFPMEKVLVSIDQFGNTSSSSIPISLVKQYGDCAEHKTINPLMCGFGIGLSWGIVSTLLDTAGILPLIHTDEYFDDGIADE